MSTTALFHRCLWKESRAWRTLWLGCTFGTIGLMLFIVGTAQWFGPGGGWTFPLLGFAMWVPGIYILASLAAMFAGEREERTADWLLVLSPRPGSVIGAKLAFAAVSGLVMQAALLLFVAAISPLDPDKQGQSAVQQFVQEDLALTTVFIVFETLAWGLFCSLWTSHALRAIVAGAATVMVINMLAATAEADGIRPFGIILTKAWADAVAMGGWLRTLGTLGVLATGVVLARRWVQGRYQFLPGTWRTPTWPRWLQVRHAAWDAASGWQRAWQRVWWLELTRMRSLLLMVLVLGLVSVLTLFIGRNASPGFAVMLGGLLPFLAGLNAWQSEQTQQHYRFYADRGISPAGLWLNKLVMWLCGSMLASVALQGLLVAAWMVGTWVNPNRWPPLFPLSNHFEPPEELYNAIANGALFVVTATVIGFLASQLFRRRVIAFGIGLLGCFGLSMALAISYAAALPLWFFGAAIPLWLVWVSARQLPRTWREEPQWRSRFAFAAELLAPPAVWCAAFAAYRVVEVPLVEIPPYESAAVIAADGFRGSPEQWSQILREAAALEAPPEIPVVVEEAQDVSGMAGMAGMEAWEVDLDAGLEINAERLAVLRDHVLAAIVITPEAAVFQRSQSQVRLGIQLFLKAAERELAQGNGAASVAWLQAAMRLTGAATCYAPLDNRSHISQLYGDDAILSDLVRWAQHPLQTEDALRQGLTACAAESRFWTVWQDDLISDYEWQRRALTEFWDWRNALFHWRLWEDWRDQRRVACAAANQMTYLSLVKKSVVRPGWGEIAEAALHDPHNAALSFRDGPYPQRFLNRPPGLDPSAILAMFDRQTRYHGMVTAAAVAGFERMHGGLPATLDDVAHYFGPNTHILRDPWSGDELRYQPQGFPQRINNETADIDPGQPLVWSVGPEHVQLIRQGEQTRLEPSTPVTGDMSSLNPSTRLIGQLRYAFAIPEVLAVEYVQRNGVNAVINTALRDE